MNTEGQQDWVDQSPDPVPLDCLDALNPASTTCAGPVEYRYPLSGTGVSFPRCDHHWAERLERQAGIDRRYPQQQPADFDPTYAGEQWDED